MSTASSPSSRQPMNFVWWIAVGGLALVVIVITLLMLRAIFGPSESLATGYGRARGGGYVNSVNGTQVLSRMFQDAGHRVSSSNRLSPRLLDADVMIWAPDDFSPPSQQVRDYIQHWLDFGGGRTFIYIGRDFDAAVEYWEDVRDLADDARARRIEREEAFAETHYLTRRFQTEDGAEGKWFTTDTKSQPRLVKELEGEWAEGIDAEKTRIPLDIRLKEPTPSAVELEQVETLLIGDGEPLVSRITRRGEQGEILVVQNGSFLLNYPLINHQHRKLAGKLVSHCGTPGKVVFLESGEYGLPIVEQDTSEGFNGFAVLKVWPINIIMLHVAVLGVLYCFAFYPIFGRPRTLPTGSTGDFGTHVTALGELLARTKNAAFAQQRLIHYRQQGQRASGKAHRPLPGVTKAAEKKPS